MPTRYHNTGRLSNIRPCLIADVYASYRHAVYSAGKRSPTKHERSRERGQRLHMAVRFGIFVPQGWRMDLQELSDPVEQYEAMTRVAKAADATDAYDSIWVYDHFHTIPNPELATVFECWTI